MSKRITPSDSRYDSLASPIKSAGEFIESNQEALLQEESQVLEGTTFKRRGLIEPQRGVQVMQVGGLEIVVGKTTPVISSNGSENFSCFMAMPFVGGFVTNDGLLHDEVCPGDIYWN